MLCVTGKRDSLVKESGDRSTCLVIFILQEQNKKVNDQNESIER